MLLKNLGIVILLPIVWIAATTSVAKGDYTYRKAITIDHKQISSVEVKTGSFAKISAVGNQIITGIGFQPKALILYTTYQTNNGFSETSHFAIGYSSGPTASRTMNMWSDERNQGGTHTYAGRGFSTKIICLSQYGEADLVSFDSNGFTLNWNVNDEPSAAMIHYTAFGGTGISAQVGTLTSNTTTGNQSISGIGFQPDFLMFLDTQHTVESAIPAEPANADGQINIGFATANKQGKRSRV